MNNNNNNVCFWIKSAYVIGFGKFDNTFKIMVDLWLVFFHFNGYIIIKCFSFILCHGILDHHKKKSRIIISIFIILHNIILCVCGHHLFHFILLFLFLSTWKTKKKIYYYSIHTNKTHLRIMEYGKKIVSSSQ